MTMRELYDLGVKHGATKTSMPNYFPEYARILEGARAEKIKLLEIGLDLGGSHRMWKEYLPNADIFCIDPFKDGQPDDFQERLEQEGIKTFKGNQLDREHLRKFIEVYGSDFDIIIDDAAHMPDAIQVSLGFLFPHLKTGGIYIVEDLQCAVSRQSRIEQVNKNIEGILDIPHVMDYHLWESYSELKENKTWVSNVLLPKEKAFLAKNILTCEFFANGNMCKIVKK